MKKAKVVDSSFEDVKRAIKEFDNSAAQLGVSLKQVFRAFGKKCPRCDSHNIKQVRPSLWRWMMAPGLAPWGSPPKTLNVCRDCGFSWENR